MATVFWNEFVASETSSHLHYQLIIFYLCSLDKELVYAGAPAEVVGVWRNTRTKESPEWRSMLPFGWEYLAAKGIIVR